MKLEYQSKLQLIRKYNKETESISALEYLIYK